MNESIIVWALLTLTFLNPSGEGNDVVANSSMFAEEGRYDTLEACEAGGDVIPDVLINTGKTPNLTFTRTSACFPVVKNSAAAGAWMTLATTTQNTGLRFQQAGQSITLPVISYDSCLTNLDIMLQLNPNWRTDLPLIFYGSCTEAG